MRREKEKEQEREKKREKGSKKVFLLHLRLFDNDRVEEVTEIKSM